MIDKRGRQVDADVASCRVIVIVLIHFNQIKAEDLALALRGEDSTCGHGGGSNQLGMPKNNEGEVYSVYGFGVDGIPWEIRRMRWIGI